MIPRSRASFRGWDAASRRADPRAGLAISPCPVRGRCVWGRAGRAKPDPAVGSAGVSTPQPRFEGSERQARGRVLQALTAGRPASTADFAAHIVDGLVADRLVVRRGDVLTLP